LIKSTILSLNAGYFWFVELSPFSTHSLFPTRIVVSKLTFPELSTIVPASITIFVTPFILPKFPKVNLYPISFTLSTSASPCFVASCFNVAVSVIGTKSFVIDDSNLSSTYTLILSFVSELDL